MNRKWMPLGISALVLTTAACTNLSPTGTKPGIQNSNLREEPNPIISNNSAQLSMTLSNGSSYSTMAVPSAPTLQHVYVKFGQVQVHFDGAASASASATESADTDPAWINFPASASQTIDLMALAQDTPFGFVSTLEKGTYTQIRLPVESASLVFSDASTASLNISSGNLKIIKPFEIKAGYKTTLHFDFDCSRSLISAGGAWRLNPTAVRTVPSYEEIPAATPSATSSATP